MKIAITGHTRGIGQACAELLAQEHDIIGYSRSTGCDISALAFPKDYWSELDDCDVFINNAHHEDHQLRILEVLFERWQKQDKLIINNSSMIADLNDATDNDIGDYHDYQRWKRELNQRTEDYWNMAYVNADIRIRVSTIYTGATQTELLDYGVSSGTLANVALGRELMQPMDVARAFKCIVDNPMIKEIKIFNR